MCYRCVRLHCILRGRVCSCGPGPRKILTWLQIQSCHTAETHTEVFTYHHIMLTPGPHSTRLKNQYLDHFFELGGLVRPKVGSGAVRPHAAVRRSRHHKGYMIPVYATAALVPVCCPISVHHDRQERVQEVRRGVSSVQGAQVGYARFSTYQFIPVQAPSSHPAGLFDADFILLSH